ncbi:MAG: hypothetical protein ACXVXP_10490 [Mycobacteriaceae bacterium]
MNLSAAVLGLAVRPASLGHAGYLRLLGSAANKRADHGETSARARFASNR